MPRHPIRAVAAARGVQRSDKRLPLLRRLAYRKQLLALVNHQRHPPLPGTWLPRRFRGSQRCLPGGQGETGRVGGQPLRNAAASAPATGAIRTASSSTGLFPGVNIRHGHDAASGATASPASRNRGSTPARNNEDLPAPDTPDTTSIPIPPLRRADIRPRQGRCFLAAEEQPRVLLSERAQPAVREGDRRGVPGRPSSRYGL